MARPSFPSERPEDEDFHEHDISKRVKKKKIEETAAHNPAPSVKGERSFYIMLAGVFVVLVILIFGYQFLIGKTKVKSIDELHSENLAGTLDPEEGYMYNGFSFVKVEDQWWTRFQRANSSESFNVQFRYAPHDVLDIPLTGDYVFFLRFNATYVTFDPLGENLSYVALTASDISQAMVKVFGIVTFPACTRQDNATCLELPVLECEPGRPVVYLLEDDTPYVESRDTCVVVHGRGLDMVKAADRLLLAWYGIMP